MLSWNLIILSLNITKHLRGIWHTWHFKFALSSVVTALCVSFCIACLHPLTRRYEEYGYQITTNRK
ncbi:hypothetical protein [Vibrio mimicus]|uniref:hypothetical protein n=1 Tax=Vibrio mimicus TaxID=674 RepID=UPI0037094C8D